MNYLSNQIGPILYIQSIYFENAKLDEQAIVMKIYVKFTFMYPVKLCLFICSHKWQLHECARGSGAK